jgi:hypothetical protein
VRLLAVATNQTKQLTVALTKNTLANWLLVFGLIQMDVTTGSLMIVLRAIFPNVSTNMVSLFAQELRNQTLRLACSSQGPHSVIQSKAELIA